MRIIILYRPDSEHARRVEEYITDFERFHPGQPLETHNVDSMEGSKLVQLYGAVEYPVVLALTDNGQMQQMWVGADKMPLMNDLAYYSQQ